MISGYGVSKVVSPLSTVVSHGYGAHSVGSYHEFLCNKFKLWSSVLTSQMADIRSFRSQNDTNNKLWGQVSREQNHTFNLIKSTRIFKLFTYLTFSKDMLVQKLSLQSRLLWAMDMQLQHLVRITFKPSIRTELTQFTVTIMLTFLVS